SWLPRFAILQELLLIPNLDLKTTFLTGAGLLRGGLLRCCFGADSGLLWGCCLKHSLCFNRTISRSICKAVGMLSAANSQTPTILVFRP
ncbi:hypothetical protein R6Q59_025418, partial [Mikania micrantha]